MPGLVSWPFSRRYWIIWNVHYRVCERSGESAVVLVVGDYGVVRVAGTHQRSLRARVMNKATNLLHMERHGHRSWG